MRFLAVCALLFVSGVSEEAMAQAAPAPAGAAAQLSARARALIAASGAGEFFEPVASTSLVSVRHRPSGLVCSLDPNAQLRIIIFPPNTSGAARGEDVSCGSAAAGGAMVLYATRYRRDVSLDDAFANAVGEFNAVHPTAQSYTPQVQIDMSDRPSLPDTRTATFLLRGPTGMNFTGIWVAKVDGWVLKMRFTGPQGMASELSSGVAWTTALSALARGARR